MPKTGKEALLAWCQDKTKEFSNVSVTDFTTSWQDGLAFCALLHKHIPRAIAFHILRKNERDRNLELAFSRAQEYASIPAIITKEDVIEGRENAIIQYLTKWYWALTGGKGEDLNRQTESIIVDDRLRPQKASGAKVSSLTDKFSPTLLMSNRASVRFAEQPPKEGEDPHIVKKRIPPPRPKRPDLSRTASKKTIGTLSYKSLTSDEEIKPEEKEETKPKTIQEIPIEEPPQKPLTKSTDSIDENPPTVTPKSTETVPTPENTLTVEPAESNTETPPISEPTPADTTEITPEKPDLPISASTDTSESPTDVTSETPTDVTSDEEREYDPHRRSSFTTLRLHATTTSEDKPTSTSDRPVAKKISPPIIESIEPFSDEIISEGIFKTEQQKRKSVRASDMNINLQVTLQVKVPAISETRPFVVGFNWTVERVIEKIKNELFPLLVQYDLSTYDLGYYNPDFPDYLVFLNHAVTIGECKLDKESILNFVDMKDYSDNLEEEEVPEEAPQELEGFMWKEGLKGLRKAYKRRWFSTEENRLNYYRNRQDKDPIGVVTLTPSVTICRAEGEKRPLFLVNAPKRTYRFLCNKTSDMESWVSGLQQLTKYYAVHLSKIKDIKAGFLFKRGAKVKNWKRRLFILRNDFLYYYSGDSSGSQHLKGKIALYSAVIQDVPKGERPWSFEIITKERVFLISSDSEQEKVSWIKEVQEQIAVVSADVNRIFFTS